MTANRAYDPQVAIALCEELAATSTTRPNYGGVWCPEALLYHMTKQRADRRETVASAQFKLLKDTLGGRNVYMKELVQISSQVSSVVELGVKDVQGSSWAFLYGLQIYMQQHPSSKPRFISCDLVYHPNIEPLRLAARQIGVEYFMVRNFLFSCPRNQSPLLFTGAWGLSHCKHPQK
jgi:hypothetical protein